MGMPAARITDMHVCPMVTGIVPHVGGPITLGSFNVLTGKLPQARVTDMLVCVGPPDIIVKGSTGVFVNNLPAARMLDLTAHGGTIVLGFPTVLIGETKGGGGGGAGGASAGGSAAGADAGTGGEGRKVNVTAEPGQVSVSATHPTQQANSLITAQATGAPFCEACFAAAQARANKG